MIKLTSPVSFFQNIALLCMTAGLATLAPAQQPDNHDAKRQGDAAYDKSNYTLAEQHYREAARLNPSDAGAHYNLGNAIYQQTHYPEAAKTYAEAAKAAKTPTLRADALYNLGNSELKQQHYKEAVSAYEQSLRLRPGDPETKVNLQIAKKKLRQQQPPPPKQQQQKQQQQQQQQQQQEQQQQKQRQQKQQQQVEFDMSKDEARRLLESAVAPQDQQNTQKYRQGEMPKGGRPKKDW